MKNGLILQCWTQEEIIGESFRVRLMPQDGNDYDEYEKVVPMCLVLEYTLKFGI